MLIEEEERSGVALIPPGSGSGVTVELSVHAEQVHGNESMGALLNEAAGNRTLCHSMISLGNWSFTLKSIPCSSLL